MKKAILLLGGIALLFVLFFAQQLFSQKSSMDDERVWFTKALRYEFSARVDSVRMFNEHTGRLWCRITAGDPQVHREDSLKKLFKNHDMLYLIFHRSADSIIFIVPNGNLVAAGDSVRVSSSRNIIQFFRNEKQVAIDSLTSTLTGYGRPFFMKWKKK